jgi:hypothetical protein
MFSITKKMTPSFLKLAKIQKNTGTLADVKNDNGDPFISAELRKKFIWKNYRDTYGSTGLVVTVGDIKNFLGPDICNNPITQSKKIPATLSTDFDLPLSLAELDLAISNANSASAGGTDGINNKVLKKFWYLFRLPLFEYASFIHNGGALTQTFRSAAIRLIPKKGDLTRIGNWRPISLLNCIYKIISRAVNNRLQKAAPFILSRAQKGFVKKRFIQECLINVIEKIAFCNTNQIPALGVAIDQSKAFDTISHSYVAATYRFFGFGENFIWLMNGIGMGRTASLMWEDGTISQSFELQSGRAQGDGPSPLQYNFGEQILLLKIELDPAIRSAAELAVEASRLPAPLDWFASEVNKKQTRPRL